MYVHLSGWNSIDAILVPLLIRVKSFKMEADSVHCECGSEEQTPEHILQTCPHLKTVRQQFWPEDTEVGTKLWGQAAELQRMADFLAATGLRI